MSPSKELPQVRLVERFEVTEDLFILRFEPEVGAPFTRADGKWNFTAGQFITLGLPGPEKQIERAYSVASSPYDPYFEFFVELVPTGQLTPRMHKLKVGDRMSCRKATGKFTLDASRACHLQVATVTGVAPYLSVLKTCRLESKAGRAPPDKRFLLVYAASRARELAYSEYLRECAEAGFVTFVPSVSRPWESPEWTGETGRCEDIVRKHLDRVGFEPARTTAYLCGNGDMIKNVEGILKRARFAPEQIKKEEYW